MLFLSCFGYVSARLFIDALWSAAGKGLASWLSFVMFNCEVVTFSIGILGQVWCLIVSIPGICSLSYFTRTPPWCCDNNEADNAWLLKNTMLYANTEGLIILTYYFLSITTHINCIVIRCLISFVFLMTSGHDDMALIG